MEARGANGLRVALVDLDARGLDAFRAVLGAADAPRDDDAGRPRGIEVRFVVDRAADGVLFRWARLAGVPRAGEIAALGGAIVDAVLVGGASPRTQAAVRLAASLGARVAVLPAHEAAQSAESRP